MLFRMGGISAVVAGLGLTGCATIVDNVVADAIITPKGEVHVPADAVHVMGPHMTMTKKKTAQPGDQARAEALARRLKANIQKYRDVKAAEADGYQSFPPDPPPSLKEVHYVNRQFSADEKDAIDPAKPGSLLYRPMPDGRMKLIGAMFTAPPTASLRMLNDRVPLSVTQWHLHTNICVPKPLWSAQEWKRTTYDGKPLFGVDSPIATRATCESARGRFAPVIFGWMTHAYVMADVNNVWDQSFGHDDHE